MLANSIKLVSGIVMLTIALQGDQATILWVIIAYVLTGIGAAVYSPAKYGILTQLCGTEQLVKANGLMEGSTIVAILLGFVVLLCLWICHGQSILNAVIGELGTYNTFRITELGTLCTDLESDILWLNEVQTLTGCSQVLNRYPVVHA